MIEIGRLVVKLAGRDAGLKGLIVDVLDKNYILIDGQVRRRKCNILHIEPLQKVLKIKKGASHNEVVTALKEEGIEVIEKKKKQNTQRPLKKRRGKEEVKETKEVKPKKVIKKKQ